MLIVGKVKLHRTLEAAAEIIDKLTELSAGSRFSMWYLYLRRNANNCIRDMHYVVGTENRKRCVFSFERETFGYLHWFLDYERVVVKQTCDNIYVRLWNSWLCAENKHTHTRKEVERVSERKCITSQHFVSHGNSFLVLYRSTSQRFDSIRFPFTYLKSKKQIYIDERSMLFGAPISMYLQIFNWKYHCVLACYCREKKHQILSL